MKYVNLTPRWTEILPTLRMLVESVMDRGVKSPSEVMTNFWTETARMAQGADNFNDLVAYLRHTQGWKDDRIKQALIAGREHNEVERTTVHESVE